MYEHKHTCRTTAVANDRGREAYIRNGLLDKEVGSLYTAIWKYIWFYKGKQKPPDMYSQTSCLITKSKTIRHKWFKIHARSIQIQRIRLKVKWNSFNYFLIVRNCLDVSLGQSKYEYIPSDHWTKLPGVLAPVANPTFPGRRLGGCQTRSLTD